MAVTGKGAINNTVGRTGAGQGRRHLRKVSQTTETPGACGATRPRRGDTCGQDERGQRAVGDTQADTPGDREGAGSRGQAGAPSSPSSLALDLQVQRRPGQRALSPRSQAVGPGSGARAEQPRGLGLSFAFRVLVIDVAAHGSRVHSCRERPLGGREDGREPEAHTLAHTHPWVRRVFRSRACGSRAGHRAKDRVRVVRRGPQTPCPPPPMASSASRRPPP